MATPQAGPVGTPMQLAQEHHHILNLEPLGTGTFANVYLSIPLAIANEIFSDFHSSSIEQSAACARLRASLQAIKITKGKVSDTADKLDSEIVVLTHIAKSGHPNIVSLLQSDTAKQNKGWYTQELLTGDTYGAYSDLLVKLRRGLDNPPASFAPVAFAWHLIHQLTEALLALHFGDKDGKQATRWPIYTHNDNHLNNMLFRSGSGAFGNYPDVVLVDFGRVKRLDGLTDRAKFFEAQRGDIKLSISTVTLYGFPEDPSLNALWDEIRDLDIKAGEDNNLTLKLWMRDLRDRAFQERQRLYDPLHADVVQHFQQEIISDAEIWERTSSLRSP